MNIFESFFPLNEEDQGKWFDNYIQNLPEVGPLMGLTTDQITAKLNEVRQQQDLNADAKLKTIDKEKSVSLKTVNLKTVLKNIKKDAQTIKNNPNYTPEIGAKLQIEGKRISIDLTTYQPVVRLKQSGGLVQVTFSKNGATGAHIYRKMAAETTFSLVGRSTDNTFTDPLPQTVQGAPELRQYMVVLLEKDTETGLPSKVMMIVLGA